MLWGLMQPWRPILTPSLPASQASQTAKPAPPPMTPVRRTCAAAVGKFSSAAERAKDMRNGGM